MKICPQRLLWVEAGRMAACPRPVPALTSTRWLSEKYPNKGARLCEMPAKEPACGPPGVMGGAGPGRLGVGQECRWTQCRTPFRRRTESYSLGCLPPRAGDSIYTKHSHAASSQTPVRIAGGRGKQSRGRPGLWWWWQARSSVKETALIIQPRFL